MKIKTGMKHIYITFGLHDSFRRIKKLEEKNKKVASLYVSNSNNKKG